MVKKYLVALFVLFGLNSYLLAENIYPISREMGSGTRGAFVNIFDVKEQVGQKKIDANSKKAQVKKPEPLSTLLFQVSFCKFNELSKSGCICNSHIS